MITIEEIRRAKLKQLVTTIGGGKQSALADAIGVSASQLSQWINASPDSKTGKPRSMDSNTARRIEQVLGMTGGWMDQATLSNDPSSEHTAYGIEFSSALPKTPKFAPVINWVNLSRELFVDNSHFLHNDQIPIPDHASDTCKWVKLPFDLPRFGLKAGHMVALEQLKDGRSLVEGDLYLFKTDAGLLFLGEYRALSGGAFEAMPDHGRAYDSQRHGLSVLALHRGTWK